MILSKNLESHKKEYIYLFIFEVMYQVMFEGYRAHKVKITNFFMSPNLFVFILDKINKIRNWFGKALFKVNKFRLLGLITTEDITKNMKDI